MAARKAVVQVHRKSVPHEKIGLRGFARVQIGERLADGGLRIVGDSGWIKNTFTAFGRNDYIAGKIGGVTNSKTPSHLVVATQSTAVDSTQTVLVGEHTVRVALTPTTVATGTLRMTGSYGSAQNDAAKTIGTIGVHNTSTNGAGSLASGQTYTTSQWQTNQDVSMTYEWRFS